VNRPRAQTRLRRHRASARTDKLRVGRWRYFEALFTTLDMGVCFLDRHLRVVAVNPAMRRLHAPGEPDGAQALDRSSPAAEAPCATDLAAEALALGRSVERETEVPGPDGAVRYYNATCHPLRNAAGGVFGLAEFFRDVTCLGQARQDMQLALNDIEMLLGSIRSILVAVDGDDRIRRFNASAETVLGLSAREVVGRDFFSVGLSFEGEAVGRAMAESRARLVPTRVEEVRCRLPDGTERLLGLTVNPVPAPRAGGRPGVLILGQDLAAIKARQLRDSHERRMQAIGRLAAGIAHEINTPIQYLGYNASFLDEAFTGLLAVIEAHEAVDRALTGLPDQLAAARARVRELAAEVDLDYLRQEIPQAIANSRKGIGQVTDIVAAMRQMIHPGTGEGKFADINAVVRDIVTVTRNAWKNVAEMSLSLAPDLPHVYGLPHELSQVLLNLVLNAAQALEERQSREPWARGRIDIATALVGDWVEVAVSDTGPGIPEAIQARIFEPFFTTKEAGKGTGQGLAICHAVMERHGGGIDFVTRPGEGTTFTLRFPAGGGTSSGATPSRTDS
jgi:two-component system, NtrC family, sensor kinase